MAFWLSYKHLTLVAISIFFFYNHGRADEHQAGTGAAAVLGNQYLPGSGGVDEYPNHSGSNDDEYPYQRGGEDHDPAQFSNTALECFGNNKLYQSCEESYRLTVSGDLHVPPDYTNEFCGGPCVKETHLVLSCIEGILSQFMFYNKATVYDIRETIKTGCSHGPERGDFDVSRHLQYEEGSAKRATFPFIYVLVFAIGYLFL